MSSVAQVAVHPGQFPAQVRRDLLDSLRSRRVNHKFLYDSYRQTQKWLALHEAYSPARTDDDCAAIYDSSFRAAARQINAPAIHLVGLGCGGGQKDARLLQLLRPERAFLAYSPFDVSLAMVLVARAAAIAAVPDCACQPLVCDFGAADDLAEFLERQPDAHAARLVTFFGTLHNFEPQLILPRIAALLRRGDHLLLSTNLAPGTDYSEGVRKIFPLYDNPLTRDWLLTFLLDLGVESADGELRFAIEPDPAGSGLERIAADFHFARARELRVDAESFSFRAGESIRLFYSYRHTPERLGATLPQQDLRVLDQWVTASGEEGVFLCCRETDSKTG